MSSLWPRYRLWSLVPSAPSSLSCSRCARPCMLCITHVNQSIQSHFLSLGLIRGGKQHTPSAKCAMCQVPCVHTCLTIICQCVIAVVYLVACTMRPQDHLLTLFREASDDFLMYRSQGLNFSTDKTCQGQLRVLCVCCRPCLHWLRFTFSSCTCAVC